MEGLGNDLCKEWCCKDTDGKGWGVFFHLLVISQLLVFLMRAVLTGMTT